MKTRYSLVIVLALIAALSLWNLVLAAKPPGDDPNQGDERWVGLVSTTVECLAVEAGERDSASANVLLQWDGQIEEAFLALSAAGSQGGHSIYVNGQRVGSAPVRSGGSLCLAESPAIAFGSTDLIPVPVQLLTKGENRITLTNDADIEDGWTAANLQLEIHGVLTGPPVAALEMAQLAVERPSFDAQAPILGSVWLTSTYELSQGRLISQLVSYQVPTGYTGSVPVPLLIGLHGMGGSGEYTRDFLAAEADQRGWLLAAPELHGSHFVNTGMYSLAWPGAQHDIMDTVAYMMSEYEVDPSRIYIAGGSMGGQTGAMMAAKYPDVFAAVGVWSSLTDLTDWYLDLDAFGDPYGVLVRIRQETGGTPLAVPFEYQRRSPIKMPQNSRLIPIKMWHDVDDLYVPIYHSRDHRDAINAWTPQTPVLLIEIPSDANACPPDAYEHCYSPELVGLFDYLESFTQSAQPPLSLNVRSDESKPYYWLDLALTGGDHWSQVETAYSLSGETVTATVSDDFPLTLGFNLGSAPIIDSEGIGRSGLGLPATTYLIKGGGNYQLKPYTSGYLTATLTTTGQYTLTISALTVNLSATPVVGSASPVETSTIQATASDRLGNLIPDGTTILFSTTAGTFPNGLSTYATTSAGGQATTVLSLGPAAGPAEVTASVETVTGSTTVEVIHPFIDLSVVPNQAFIYSGQTVTYTYYLTNSGDITLTVVTVTDDNGTPGNSGDDLTVCADITLAPKAKRSCSRSATLTQTTTNTATATGQDPLGHVVTSSDSQTVVLGLFKYYFPLSLKN